jgi:hypothetical protein
MDPLRSIHRAPTTDPDDRVSGRKVANQRVEVDHRQVAGCHDRDRFTPPRLAKVVPRLRVRNHDRRSQLSPETFRNVDTGGWKLNGENPDIKFIAPKSGATGWIDTFAIPAKGKNDAAAYAWINFNMRPEIAAKVATSAGNFTASKGADQLMPAKLKAQFAESFPEAAIKNIRWYPAVPAGLEEIEGRILDRVKAAN